MSATVEGIEQPVDLSSWQAEDGVYAVCLEAGDEGIATSSHIHLDKSLAMIIASY